MNWFKHDTNASTDAKIKKLLIKHGASGYAVYFHCLELIAGNVSEANVTFELEHDAEIIADDLRITGTADESGRAIVEKIMHTIIDLGLFQEDNGHIFCFKLLNRLDSSMTSNPRLRSLIAEAKENIMTHHDDVMTHHDDVMTHHDDVMIEEKRKEEIRKEDISTTKSASHFSKPSLVEVKAYIQDNHYSVDAEKWLNHYESNGWMVGRTHMKDWKACVRTWNGNRNKFKTTSGRDRSFDSSEGKEVVFL